MATNIKKDGIRSFRAKRDDGSFLALTTRKPTQEELGAARYELSATFNQSLMHGLPTRTKMMKSLEKNGLWGNTEKEAFQALREKALQTNKQLTATKEKISKAKAAGGDVAAFQTQLDELQADYDGANTQFVDLRGEIESMLEHTADARADDAYRNFLVACVTEYADGTKKGDRVWSSLDAYIEDGDMLLTQRALYEYLYCQADQPSGWKDPTVAEAPKALEESKEEAKPETKEDPKPAVAATTETEPA